MQRALAWARRIGMTWMRIKSRHAMAQGDPQPFHRHLRPKSSAMSQRDSDQIPIAIHAREINSSVIGMLRNINGNWSPRFYGGVDSFSQSHCVPSRKQFLSRRLGLLKITQEFQAV